MAAHRRIAQCKSTGGAGIFPEYRGSPAAARAEHRWPGRSARSVPYSPWNGVLSERENALVSHAQKPSQSAAGEVSPPRVGRSAGTENRASDDIGELLERSGFGSGEIWDTRCKGTIRFFALHNCTRSSGQTRRGHLLNVVFLVDLQ